MLYNLSNLKKCLFGLNNQCVVIFNKMLKKKLKLTRNEMNKEVTDPKIVTNGNDDITSKHFQTPFWKQFYEIECLLNDELRNLKIGSKVTHVYNPIEYASDLHCAYLRKFLNGPKAVMFVGMNPGPNGMVQTGVPFGNIVTVRDWMKLESEVEKPEKEHPKRPVVGLACTTEEPSGTRFWGILKEISTDLDIFAINCYMHNFCPLAFFDTTGRNITPSELKGDDKKIIRDICIKYLKKKIELISPKFVIGVGSYVGDCLNIVSASEEFKNSEIKFLQLAHPSPRSLNNQNWPEKARKFFEENNLIKYLKNEI